MDIAKIRKKLKDTESAGETGPGAAPVPESVVAGEEAKPAFPVTPGRAETKEAVKETGPEDGEDGSLVDLLTFNVGKEEFAFRISEVLEIVRVQNITRIPNAKDFLIGITSLRGKIIPVIDLGKRLFLKRVAEGSDKRQKIMILKGPKGPIGVVIDKIKGVVRPSLSDISETPPHLPEAEMKFIEGVAIIKGRFISIIRIEEAVDI